MVTITVENRLSGFIEECLDKQYNLEILLFLGKHPSTRFDQMVLAQAATDHGLDMEPAVRHLVQRGLVKTWADNGLRLYSLTMEEPLRGLVLSLVTLNRYQLHLVLKQIQQKCEPPLPLPVTA